MQKSIFKKKKLKNVRYERESEAHTDNMAWKILKKLISFSHLIIKMSSFILLLCFKGLHKSIQK